MPSLPRLVIVTLTVTTLAAPTSAYDLTSVASIALGTAAFLTSQPALQTLGLAAVKYGASRFALEETLHSPYAPYEAHKFNVARLQVLTAVPVAAAQAVLPGTVLGTIRSYAGQYLPSNLNLQEAVLETATFLTSPSLDQTEVDEAIEGTVTLAQMVANAVPEASDLPSYISDWATKAENAVDSNWDVVGPAVNSVLSTFKSTPLGTALATVGWMILQFMGPKNLTDLVLEGYLYPTPIFDAYELITGIGDVGAGIASIQVGLRLRSDPEGALLDTFGTLAGAVYEQITGNPGLDSVLEQCEILTPGDVEDIEAEGESKFVDDAKSYLEEAIHQFNLGSIVDQALPYLGTAAMAIGALRTLQGLMEVADALVSLGYLARALGASLPVPAEEEVEAALPALESAYSPLPLPPTP